MNKEKAKKWALVACCVVVALVVIVPFSPIGVRKTYFDFNNGNIKLKTNYFLWFDKEDVIQSPLSLIITKGREDIYPELLMEIDSVWIIPMKKIPRNSVQTLPMFYGMELFSSYTQNEKYDNSDVIFFRDTILNKWATPELIEEAKKQGEARGGYDERKEWDITR